MDPRLRDRLFWVTHPSSAFVIPVFFQILIADLVKIINICCFRYVYTDEINLNNFELVCDICYAAKK